MQKFATGRTKEIVGGCEWDQQRQGNLQMKRRNNSRQGQKKEAGRNSGSQREGRTV
jgi:hypothetical protein